MVLVLSVGRGLDCCGRAVVLARAAKLLAAGCGYAVVSIGGGSSIVYRLGYSSPWYIDFSILLHEPGSLVGSCSGDPGVVLFDGYSPSHTYHAIVLAYAGKLALEELRRAAHVPRSVASKTSIVAEFSRQILRRGGRVGSIVRALGRKIRDGGYVYGAGIRHGDEEGAVIEAAGFSGRGLSFYTDGRLAMAGTSSELFEGFSTSRALFVEFTVKEDFIRLKSFEAMPARAKHTK